MSPLAAPVLTAIPSPESAVWWLGPFPVRAYALCIMLGIVAAIAISYYRLRARGGTGQEIFDVSVWAIVLGILGGRLYHVVSSPWPYFGEDGNLADAVRIWEGGLGIWGAVALGAVGVWIGARRHGHSFWDLVDAVAPGLLVAQALGRWGNWFNNELYGGQSEAPWAVTIHEWDAGAGRSVVDSSGEAVVLGTYQPIFLYESLWCLVLAVLILLADRRFRFARGQVIALYVVGYTLGRFFFELMRTDPAQLVLGQRINVWVSVAVFLLGLALYVVQGRRADLPARGPAAEGDEQRSRVGSGSAGTG
ncbi:MAG: prolipoprotein diacylglyceryl transferase [Actinomycetota bacterium]|nr:prolipoprotein diacylglyceryl transferase [Actinomycetota bacterium]